MYEVVFFVDRSVVRSVGRFESVDEAAKAIPLIQAEAILEAAGGA